MNKSKLLKRLTALVLILATAAGGYFGYDYYKKASAQRQALEALSNSAVTAVEPIRKTDLREIITALGSVALESEEKIYSEGGGLVDKVLVDVGDDVTEGQVIITFDNKDNLENLKKQLSEAKINLSNQQLTLKSMALPATNAEIKKLNDTISAGERSVRDYEVSISDKERAVEEAVLTYNLTNEKIENYKLTIEKLEETIENNKLLLEVGAISAEAYKDSEESLTNAQLTLSEYYRTLSSNEKAVEDARKAVETAERTLADAQADLESAKQELAEANVVLKEEADRINYEKQLNQITLSEMSISNIEDEINKLTENSKSGVSGTVMEVMVERGMNVSDGTQLMTVSDFSKLIVKADISEYDAPNLALGQKVEMTSDGISGVTYIGEITKIGTQAVTKTTSGGSEAVVEIEATVKNADDKLKPGFSLDMDIVLLDRADVIAVSISAVQRDRETRENYVFTVDAENVISKRVVELGAYGDLEVEILSGLNEGDLVVTSPSADLQEGMTIVAGTGAAPGQGAGGRQNQGGGVMNFGGGGMMPSGGGAMPAGRIRGN